jgi:hypothetical protein
MLKARFAKGLQTNIYEVNVKVDFPYDCREKVPAASGKTINRLLGVVALRKC